ncbi:winged helix DNA-binding domain-containing protein [Streptomyces filamentosus]|uniref:winged helix DNA-binding domain-containing protein n=1 Tax=Streptomyces filamentosus TaxID=67294 RepID=UPI0036EE6B19
MTVLDARALGRAALARQFLLARTDAPALDVVTRLGGMQAQEPQEPFTGLWSRTRDFRPETLDALLTGRALVRLPLMRRTIHLVAAEDALAWHARHATMLRTKVLTVYRDELAGIDPDALAAAGRAVMADGTPRTTAELVGAVADRWPDRPRRPLGELLVSGVIPMVQLPPRGLWGSRAGVRNQTLAAWLGREVPPLPEDPADPVGQALLRRYLAAHGPASSSDLRAWCGLTGLPAAVKAVREELVAFRDERGRELLDLPDAPRPDPDTPAPVRFLPAFDNAILGYQDRSRIIDDAHRGLSVAGERVVLVDGRVSATWTLRGDTVAVTPLRRLSRAERTEVTEEGGALAAFLTGRESDRVAIDAP